MKQITYQVDFSSFFYLSSSPTSILLTGDVYLACHFSLEFSPAPDPVALGATQTRREASDLLSQEALAR